MSRLLLWGCLGVLLPSCSVPDASGRDDAGVDATMDTEVLDATEDRYVDSDAEAEADAREDASEDAAEDASEDAAEDASEDAAEDTSEDAAEDTSEDAAEDASEDAGEDVAEDAGGDAAEDADAADVQQIPTFSCGPGWTLYDVVDGVRCVRVLAASGTQGPGVVWYGEGKFVGGFYRHVGYAFWKPTESAFVGIAADIFGNGEAHAQYVDNIRIPGDPGGIFPALPIVGPWDESWVRNLSGSTTSYTSPAAFRNPAVDCGPNFYQANAHGLEKWQAYNYLEDGLESVTGVRCVLKVGDFLAWFGSGAIRTRSSVGTSASPGTWDAPSSYAHMGFKDGGSNYSQLDLCSNGDACAAIEKTAVMESLPAGASAARRFHAAGMDELWLRSSQPRSLRFRAVRTAYADGAFRAETDANDILAYLARANAIYNGQGIEFLHYAGSGPTDLTTIYEDSINRMSGGEPPSDAAHFEAEKHPNVIMGYFTWGGTEGSNNTPTAIGASDSDKSYLQLSGARLLQPGPSGAQKLFCNVADETHLAHELGRYLGLHDTFTQKPQTIAEAEAGFDGDKATLDGDLGVGIPDTLADPNVRDLTCDTTVVSVTLSGIQFPLDNRTSSGQGTPDYGYPRNNVMSNSFGAGFPDNKGITSGQTNRLFLILDSDARSRLFR